MSTPQINVDLVEVRAGDSAGEDWDDPAAEGDPLWEGSTGAYLRENEDRLRSGNEGSVVIRRTLIIMARDVPVDFEPQQVVTVRRRRGGDLVTAPIEGIGRPDPPPGFARIGTVELILQPA
jgi:hypothetical protein